MEYWAEHLYSTQTAFWRPARSSDFVRTAFGLEYPVVQVPDGLQHYKHESLQHDDQSTTQGVPSMPDTCGQRLSIYIQLKRRPKELKDPQGPDLGLSENTIIVLDSMHQGMTTDELSKTYFQISSIQ